MNRKYKFGEKEGAYFISFSTVYWIDVFNKNYGNNDQTILEIDLN